jgi:hypothetical protein
LAGYGKHSCILPWAPWVIPPCLATPARAAITARFHAIHDRQSCTRPVRGRKGIVTLVGTAAGDDPHINVLMHQGTGVTQATFERVYSLPKTSSGGR